MNYIPYGRQDVTSEDIDAVLSVLKSDYLTQGPLVPLFESSVSEYVGASFAVAVNSATSALHIACLSLGVGPGDSVWTSPITFVASANCALYCGADIDFVDIDPLTFNMSVDALKQKLIEAEGRGRLPKVVIPVHMCGRSCDMKAIRQLGVEFGFKVIEDASHAIGGMFAGQRIGSCQFSDITVFSFHPVKIVTTGEGGMAITNDANLAKAMRLLRSHGITRDADQMTRIPHGPWYYQQIELGFNYRITDIQAALGLSQMSRIDTYIAKRNHLADRYDSLLYDLHLTLPTRDQDSVSAFHLYVVKLGDASLRSSVFSALHSKNIGVNVHYIPVHLQPYYARMGFAIGDFPNAESYYASAISLPMYPNLTDEQQQYVVDCVKECLS